VSAISVCGWAAGLVLLCMSKNGGSMKHFVHSVVVVLLTLPLSVQAVLTYNFDDGTRQGWTQVMSGAPFDRGDVPTNNQTAGTARYEVVADSQLLSNSKTVVGSYFGAGNYLSQAGTHRIMPVPFSDRDDNTSTFLLRSPEFYLDGSGDITAYLLGGNAGNPPPATSLLVSPTATALGFQGIALRRVSDNAYVLYAGLAASQSSWGLITFTQAALAAHVGQTYTLDLIDSGTGGWGWLAMDSVSVSAVAAISVPNFSFQNPVTASVAGSIDNWSRAGAVGVFVPPSFGQDAGPTEGSQVAYMNADNGVIFQSLGTSWDATTNYQLRVDMSARSGPGTDTMRIVLYKGTITGVGDLNAGNTVKSITLGPTVTADQFKTYSLTALASDVSAVSAGGQAIGIAFYGLNSGSGTTDFDLDNVRLYTSAPPGPTFTWDTSFGNGATITEGSGTWQLGIGGWNDAGTDATWANGKAAIFGGGAGAVGTAGTITLGGNVSPSAMTFNAPKAGTYTIDLNGNNLYVPTAYGSVNGASPTVIKDSVGTGAMVMQWGSQIFNATKLTIEAKVTGPYAVRALPGELILSNNLNDFTGYLEQQWGGPLTVTSIKNAGVPSAAGAGSEIRIGDSSTMKYIGTGDTHNRTLTLFGGGYQIISSEGTGPLVFTGPVVNNLGSGAFDKLVLAGSNTGANEIQSVLANGANVLKMHKDGTGTWVLSGVNTFTGDFDIFGGTLRIGGAGQLGSGNYSSPDSIFINTASTLDFSSSANQTLGTIVGSGALTVNGPGILTLSGANTYGGATTINGGTLKAGSSTALPTTTALTVGGTGVLDLNGFNATVASVGAGSSTAVITNSAAGSGTNTLSITTFNVNLCPACY
jgi:autotransporter-associated beta strand protein